MKPINILQLRRTGGGPPLFGVNAAPDFLSTTGTLSAVTSDTTTAAVSGGTAPFTYAWNLSANPDSIVALSPTSSSTAFRKTGAVSGSTYTAEAIVTVTDSLAQVAFSNIVSIELIRT